MKLFRPHPRISPAGAPHATEIADLLAAAWAGCEGLLSPGLLADESPGVDEVGTWFTGGFEVFRATFGDDPAGVIRCSFPSGSAVIDRLAVAPAQRGRGVGRALVDHALSRARRAGSARVWAQPAARVPGLAGIYQAAGFREAGRIRYPPWDEEVILLEIRL